MEWPTDRRMDFENIANLGQGIGWDGDECPFPRADMVRQEREMEGSGDKYIPVRKQVRTAQGHVFRGSK
jgi:hypothetical protein